MKQTSNRYAIVPTLLCCLVTALLAGQSWRAVAAGGHAEADGHLSHGSGASHSEAQGASHSDEGHHDAGDHHDEDSHEGAVHIDAGIAQQSGIRVATVVPTTLEIVTQAYGRLVIPPDREAHIHARFPGLVKAISVHVGDQVASGEVLAVIESNDSLRDYTVKAPMSGIVTKRQLNLGEVTDDDPLVVLVDDDLLWAELKIFPHQRSAVKQGQQVHLAREQRELVSTITHIAPSDNNAPYMLARVNVDNAQRQFTPGELVRADIVTATVDVPVAVQNQALQTLDGQTVVFIVEGDTYKPRVLKSGRTDGYSTEVIAGLEAGERYVVENSYLIKADIEKAGAGHHH
ncbi:MAG: efflux RND transporter periplasmic adaptor subunit [Halioglobus sp.]|nr:efflux RND transporter periplasmic adaptor subunit [Halioglobus sp.]